MKNDIYIVIDKDYIAGPVIMEKPSTEHDCWVQIEDFDAAMKTYNNHLSSLPRIKRVDNGKWKEGQELELNIHFKIDLDIVVPYGMNFNSKPIKVAIPISQPQPSINTEIKDAFLERYKGVYAFIVSSSGKPIPVSVSEMFDWIIATQQAATQPQPLQSAEASKEDSNAIEKLGISTWVEPIILENNEIGYAAHFQIDNQTFYVNPRETEEIGKWYEQALRTAFKKIKLNNEQGAQVSDTTGDAHRATAGNKNSLPSDTEIETLALRALKPEWAHLYDASGVVIPNNFPSEFKKEIKRWVDGFKQGLNYNQSK